MASGCGQADAAGPHLPIARGPLTPNVARVIEYNAVGGLRARDVGDIIPRAVDETEEAERHTPFFADEPIVNATTDNAALVNAATCLTITARAKFAHTSQR